MIELILQDGSRMDVEHDQFHELQLGEFIVNRGDGIYTNAPGVTREAIELYLRTWFGQRSDQWRATHWSTL